VKLSKKEKETIMPIQNKTMLITYSDSLGNNLKDLYENHPVAKELFEQANEILGFRITDIMFSGTDEELKALSEEYLVPGDISSAAYFMASVFFLPGSTLRLKNIGLNPSRCGILTVLEKMGAKISLENCSTVYGEERGDIYLEYGYSKEFTINVERPGKSGADEIQQMMKDFRSNPPKDLGGSVIEITKDYQSLELTKADGSKEKIDMPETSNVLQWFCTDGTKVSVRPSGTEPKIKFYLEVKDVMNTAAEYKLCEERAEKKIEAIKKSLRL